MLLYFENSKGQRCLISNPTTISDMWKDINEFLKEHNYSSNSKEVVYDEKEWSIDVGSHVEHFIVKDFDEEDYKEILKGEWK